MTRLWETPSQKFPNWGSWSPVGLQVCKWKWDCWRGGLGLAVTWGGEQEIQQGAVMGLGGLQGTSAFELCHEYLFLTHQPFPAHLRVVAEMRDALQLVWFRIKPFERVVFRVSFAILGQVSPDEAGGSVVPSPPRQPQHGRNGGGSGLCLPGICRQVSCPRGSCLGSPCRWIGTRTQLCYSGLGSAMRGRGAAGVNAAWAEGAAPEPRGDTAPTVQTSAPPGTQPAVTLASGGSNHSLGSPSNLGYNQDLKGNLLLIPMELKIHCECSVVMPQLCAGFAWNMTVNKMKYEFYWSCLHRIVIHTEWNSPLGTGQTLDLGKNISAECFICWKKCRFESAESTYEFMLHLSKCFSM